MPTTRQRGRGLSLSVERDNVAGGLYLPLGFVEVGGSQGAATMLRTLDPD